jgi:hypothetical protein
MNKKEVNEIKSRKIFSFFVRFSFIDLSISFKFKLLNKHKKKKSKNIFFNLAELNIKWKNNE